MRQEVPRASERRVCKVLAVSRSRLQPGRSKAAAKPQFDEVLVKRIRRVLEEFPTFGYRRIWAILRFRDGVEVNAKAVYRVLRLKRWFVHQRTVTPRPRVQKSRSRAAVINQRWAADV